MLFAKNLFQIILALSVTFALASCASKTEAPATLASPETGEREEINPEAYNHFTTAVIYEQEGLIEAAIHEYELALSYQPLSYDIRMALGELHFRLSRFSKAVDALLPIPDKDAAVYRVIGDCFRHLDRDAEAESAYLKALRESPNDPELNYNIGLYAVQSGDVEKALEFMKTAAYQSGNPEIHQQVADIHARMAQPDSATNYYRLAINAGGAEPSLYGKLALNYFAAGDGGSGKQTLNDALDIYPDAARLLAQLIEVYAAEKNLDSVKVLSERFLAMESKDYLALELVGQLLARREQNDLARRCFEKSLAIIPDSKMAVFFLGRIALEQENYDTAQQYFSQLIELDPTIPDGWINSAFLRERDNDIEGAVAFLNEALESVEVQRDDIRSYLSQILARNDQRDSAIAVLRGGITEGGDTVRALFNIGALYERMGKKQQAIDAFELLLTIQADHAQTLNYLGYMLVEDGERLEEALAMIERAVQVDPDNGAYLDSYAWALYKLHRYDEALVQMEKAKSVLGADPVIIDHYGDILYALGRIEEARLAWQEALSLNPDNQSLRSKLERR